MSVPWSDERRLAEFWRRVDKASDGGCWNWLGARNSKGYGQCWFRAPKTKMYLVHRVSLALTRGLPLTAFDGLVVRHSCDNPRCVNPAHLLEGTQLDNMRDRKEREGYKSIARGEASGQAKLTAAQVVEIRRLVNAGATLARVASQFGIGTTQASRIVNGQSWAHLEPNGG